MTISYEAISKRADRYPTGGWADYCQGLEEDAKTLVESANEGAVSKPTPATISWMVASLKLARELSRRMDAGDAA